MNRFHRLLICLLVGIIGCSSGPQMRSSLAPSLEQRLNECLLENGYSETDVKNLNHGQALHTNPYWHRTSSDQKTTYSKCKTQVMKEGRKYIQDNEETHSYTTGHTSGVQITPKGIRGVIGESTTETKSVRKSFQMQSGP